MQMIPYNPSSMQPTDFNKLLNDAAIRKMNQAQAASYPEVLKQHILALHLKNQIDAPNAEHAEEITMADLRNKIAETYMKHMQGGLFGAEANKYNIESKYLPAKSQAEIADKLANTNFLRAQTTNEMYKNNPILGGYAGLNNFMQDKQIDPRIRAMALGGQSGAPSQMNDAQIPFRPGYSISNGQGNPLADGMGLPVNNGALQAALMGTDQIKAIDEQRRADIAVQRKKLENENIEWQKYMDKVNDQAAAAQKIGYLSPLFLDSYKKGRQGFFPSTGSLGFLSLQNPKDSKYPLGGIFANADAQSADNLSSQIQALIAKTDIGSPGGRTPTNMQLGLASRMKFNPTMQPQAAERAVNLAVKNAQILQGKPKFVETARKKGYSKDQIEMAWQNFLQKHLVGG